jgi:molybdopterin-biosynthesis enzyme MoeA-like protein
MTDKQVCAGFGLVIIGSEILDGRIRDRHFETAKAALGERHLAFRYAMVIPDDPVVIESQLLWAEARPDPFFCCGGIGSTPDDHTRQCAARVAGLPLELHPEGVAILKRRFKVKATPTRLRLVEFPRGVTLIPNPVNEVPGFRVGKGHYLPGFPEMAAPMMEWVLDTWYERGEERIARAVLLPGAKEADLVGVMEAFIGKHPGLSFSSLPRFTDSGTEVELGIAGLRNAAEKGLEDLVADLGAAGLAYRVLGDSGRGAASAVEE